MYIVAMYVERVPNRGSPPAVLLREAWREAGKIRKRTLANLSHWTDDRVESLKRLLRGDRLVSPQDVFAVESSLPHGHVEAVLGSIGKLGLESLIGSKPSRERDLVVAMIAERLIAPSSKLATTRLWNDSTLAEELKVGDADVEELYQALDWLLKRQPRIEAKLAARHLQDGAFVLYDTTTSYYEGRCCPLARFGHDRDGKKLPVILYGLLTDQAGRPVAVQVYPGNTGDPATVGDQVDKLRERFSLSRVVIVGDRGMLTQAQIGKLKQHPGLGWISSLRSPAIRSLVESGHLQRSLFDETNLAEIHAPEFPGERLIACFNPLLQTERRRKREELLQATEKALGRLEAEVKRRTKKPLGKAEIGVKAGRVLGRFKMGKHFTLTIADAVFVWARREESIRREADLDGIYVVRTSEPAERLSAPDAVRTYKSLALVERAFRCLKGVDLLVRPIFHRTEDHVRAHIFLCMLAYYVEWHMREAWRSLLFADEDQPAKTQRDPVAPAARSASAAHKALTHTLPDGTAAHSFRTLLDELSTIVRNTCRAPGAESHAATFQIVTTPNTKQKHALELLATIAA
jgi:transposase/ribosomal protein L35